MKEITEFIKRMRLQFVQMKNLPIGIFLDINGLSNSMLIAHCYIVVESKFNCRCDGSALANLSYYYIFPLFVPSLIIQLQKDTV